MSDIDLVSVLNSIGKPPPFEGASGEFYLVRPIPGLERHRIGVDAAGAPSLLLRITHGRLEPHPPPLVLEHVTVVHDVQCRIDCGTGVVEEGRFSVIRCVSADAPLQAYFLRVLGAVLNDLGNSPSCERVALAILYLVELFRALGKPRRKTIQGLWAELLVVAQGRNPEKLLRAWHKTPEERFDFGSAEERLEVKSASGGRRQHHFSFEQLHPPTGIRAIVASLFVERNSSGKSIADLQRVVADSVGHDAELLMLLDQIVATALGEDWRYATSERFDWQIACTSLRMFEVKDIPSVPANIPPGVSGIHFESDLSGLKGLSRGALAAWGELTQSILPASRHEVEGH